MHLSIGGTKLMIMLDIIQVVILREDWQPTYKIQKSMSDYPFTSYWFSRQLENNISRFCLKQLNLPKTKSYSLQKKNTKRNTSLFTKLTNSFARDARRLINKSPLLLVIVKSVQNSLNIQKALLVTVMQNPKVKPIVIDQFHCFSL